MDVKTEKDEGKLERPEAKTLEQQIRDICYSSDTTRETLEYLITQIADKRYERVDK